MEDFATFYQYGGFFNHVVSLLAVSAVVSLIMHRLGQRRDDPRFLALADRFTAIGVAAGVLGAVFNLIDMNAALLTVPAEMAAQASHHALTIVPVPLCWALLCAIPLWVATTCLRHRLPAPARA
jgi:hypothetical protein